MGERSLAMAQTPNMRRVQRYASQFYGALIEYPVSECRRHGASIHLGAAVTAIDAGRGRIAARCHDGANPRGRCCDPYCAASPPARNNGSKINLGHRFLQLERDLYAGVELEGRLDPRTGDQIRHVSVFIGGNWRSSIQTCRRRHAEDRPRDERNAWSLSLSCAPAIARRSRG